VFPEVREALLSVVRQYEALAEGLGDQDGHTGRGR
jgi:hypothetical protein